MFRWLRARQPSNPALAVLFWVAIVAVTLVLLGLIFFQLDRLLPSMY